MHVRCPCVVQVHNFNTRAILKPSDTSEARPTSPSPSASRRHESAQFPLFYIINLTQYLSTQRPQRDHRAQSTRTRSTPRSTRSTALSMKSKQKIYDWTHRKDTRAYTRDIQRAFQDSQAIVQAATSRRGHGHGPSSRARLVLSPLHSALSCLDAQAR